MSQPPLSKRISDLENALGIRLFDRTNRHVSLTAEGLALLPKAQAAIAAFEEALACVRSSRPHSRQVRIGFPPDIPRDVLVAASEQLNELNIEAKLIEATTAEQHERLLTGQLEVGVLFQPHATRGLSSTPPLSQPLGALLSATDPLASRNEIELSDLAGYKLVIFPRAMAPGACDEILTICRARGFLPIDVEHAVRGGWLISGLFAETRKTVMFAPEQAAAPGGAFGAHPELSWLPIKGAPLTWRISAVWRSGSQDPFTRSTARVVIGALLGSGDWLPADPFESND